MREDRKKRLLESGIDFSKYGWPVKVSKIIGITPQKVKVWVKKHMPELIDIN